jgi:hypothetical protein
MAVTEPIAKNYCDGRTKTVAQRFFLRGLNNWRKPIIFYVRGKSLHF